MPKPDKNHQYLWQQLQAHLSYEMEQCVRGFNEKRRSAEELTRLNERAHTLADIKILMQEIEERYQPPSEEEIRDRV